MPLSLDNVIRTKSNVFDAILKICARNIECNKAFYTVNMQAALLKITYTRMKVA